MTNKDIEKAVATINGRKKVINSSYEFPEIIISFDNGISIKQKFDDGTHKIILFSGGSEEQRCEQLLITLLEITFNSLPKFKIKE